MALILALALGNAWFPDWLMALTERFADMLLPLVTLAVGMSLRLRLVPDYRLGLVIGLLGKLLVLPALALGLAWLFGAQPDIAVVAVLESAMPPMITAAALLAGARLAPALGSAMVAWGVLISALTVPAWYWLALQLFPLQ
jgi:malate permease and related proteins